MKKQLINYETMVKVTKAISHSREPEEVVLMTVESIKTALGVKGCSLFFPDKHPSAHLVGKGGME